jgi:hypothetical protein
MNLRGLVSGYTGVINPPTQLTLQISMGSTVSADGSVIPTYAAPVTVSGDVQALQYNDIVQMDSLNIQGQRRKIYLNGEVDGIVRSKGKGGDLITFPDGSIWLVAIVFEYWVNWVSVGVTLQDNS